MRFAVDVRGHHGHRGRHPGERVAEDGGVDSVVPGNARRTFLVARGAAVRHDASSGTARISRRYPVRASRASGGKVRPPCAPPQWTARRRARDDPGHDQRRSFPEDDRAPDTMAEPSGAHRGVEYSSFASPRGSYFPAKGKTRALVRGVVPPEEMSLDGKVAVVTGAAGGLGAAAARRLSREGCRVVAVDIDGDGARRVAEALPGQSIAVTADVSAEQDVERYLDEATRSFGRIDLHHLNAGIPGSADGFPDLSAAEFDRVMAVNVRGIFLGLRGAFRRYRSQRSAGSV